MFQANSQSVIGMVAVNRGYTDCLTNPLFRLLRLLILTAPSPRDSTRRTSNISNSLLNCCQRAVTGDALQKYSVVLFYRFILSVLLRFGMKTRFWILDVRMREHRPVRQFCPRRWLSMIV